MDRVPYISFIIIQTNGGPLSRIRIFDRNRFDAQNSNFRLSLCSSNMAVGMYAKDLARLEET